jgi:hypothetical protein
MNMRKLWEGYTHLFVEDVAFGFPMPKRRAIVAIQTTSFVIVELPQGKGSIL